MSSIMIKIQTFFLLMLDTNAREIEDKGCNTDLTIRNNTNYRNFIDIHGNQLLNNNEYLKYYNDIFNLYSRNHNINVHFIEKSKYCLLPKTEQEIAGNHGSRKKYNRIPMENNIHDIINYIESTSIPLLVRFFSQHLDLFEELQNSINK